MAKGFNEPLLSWFGTSEFSQRVSYGSLSRSRELYVLSSNPSAPILGVQPVLDHWVELTDSWACEVASASAAL